jgi:uncharacterized protein YbgA (DUF1722 family)/uncharacterized protein YbbK (DUF523 family)
MNQTSNALPTTKIRVGVSACLLGAKVRFDGGHKRNRYVDEVLRDYFEFVPFCPEVAVGLGTPRQPIRLVGRQDAPRVVGTRNPQLDVTDDLHDYGHTVARQHADLCGMIVKQGSPSCGLERVKVYSDQGMPYASSRGAFTSALMQSHPLLPVEEEGRLQDPVLRENFIARVFTYARWRELERQGLSKAGLIGFHARHKLIIMAHSPAGYRELGQLVARVGSEPLAPLGQQYIERLMQLLAERAPRKRHANVMQHLLGYLRRHLDAGDRAELLDTIEAYRNGEYPLVVPLSLLRHHFRRNPHAWVSQQVYLQPHPRELMLHNAV